MHPVLLEWIVKIFEWSAPVGLPKWLMMAKTVLIPKHHEAASITDMRPIMIFSLIYRIWSKVCAQRLLQCWTSWVPRQISGGLPGRSCLQLSLCNAVMIERELTLHSDFGGFSLDISKCFNTFGRQPMKFLLAATGWSDTHAMQWINSLRKMSRTVQQNQKVQPKFFTKNIPPDNTTKLPYMLWVQKSFRRMGL